MTLSRCSVAGNMPYSLHEGSSCSGFGAGAFRFRVVFVLNGVKWHWGIESAAVSSRKDGEYSGRPTRCCFVDCLHGRAARAFASVVYAHEPCGSLLAGVAWNSVRYELSRFSPNGVIRRWDRKGLEEFTVTRLRTTS